MLCPNWGFRQVGPAPGGDRAGSHGDQESAVARASGWQRRRCVAKGWAVQPDPPSRSACVHIPQFQNAGTDGAILLSVPLVRCASLVLSTRWTCLRAKTPSFSVRGITRTRGGRRREEGRSFCCRVLLSRALSSGGFGWSTHQTRHTKSLTASPTAAVVQGSSMLYDGFRHQFDHTFLYSLPPKPSSTTVLFRVVYIMHDYSACCADWRPSGFVVSNLGLGL